MKTFYTTFLLVLFLLFNSFSGKALSFYGGEFEWTCLGQDTFIITLTLYKVCSTQPIGTVTIPITCGSTGDTITMLNISQPSGIDITPLCDTVCNQCQSSSCSYPYGIKKYVYMKQLILAGSAAWNCCDIKMHFQRNGRVYLTTSSGGALYLEAQFNRCISLPNNSPKFSKDPLSLLCYSQDFRYNNGVIDVDKDSSGGIMDSISYEWAEPRSSQSNIINYNGQYTHNKPIYFWGFPNENLPFPRGFHLDATTGDISFRPLKIETTTAVLKIKEWRMINGVRQVIGITSRENIWVAMSCPYNNAPILNGPYYKGICAGQTVNFSITTNDYDTQDSLLISWNDAIPAASWSHNSAKHPTATFIWTPGEQDASSIPYSFTVSVSDQKCPVPGRASRTYQILVSPTPKATIMIADSGCGNYYLGAQTIAGSNPIYTWTANFSPGFVKTGNSIQHQFKSPGVYPFTLEMATQSCTRTYQDSILVNTLIFANLPDSLDLCFGDTASISPQFINNIDSVAYNWSTGDSSRILKYPAFADSTISIYVFDSTVCVENNRIFINMHNPPQVNLGPDRHLCIPSYEPLKASYSFDEGVLAKIYWYNQWDSLIQSGLNKQISIQDSGLWRCVVKDSLGCQGEDEILTFLNPEIKALASNVSICKGDTATLSAALTGSQTSNVRYSWHSVGTGKLLSLTRTLKVNPNSDRDYLLVIAESSNGVTCVDSALVRIHVFELPIVYWQGTIKSCIDGSNISLNNYIFTTPSFTTKTWSSPSSALLPDSTGDQFNPLLAGIGTHKVVVQIKNMVTGCINKDSSVVVINPLPEPNAGMDVSICTGDGNYMLNGQPNSPPGTWRSLNATGVEDSSGNYYFNPNASGITNGQTLTCVYHFADWNGCENEDTVDITVYMSPIVDAGTSLSVPIDTGLVMLQGVPVGGTWSGPGVSGNKFDPAVAGIGSFTLSYTYTNVICTNEDSIIITVLKANDILEFSNCELLIYPNPATSELFIRFNNASNLIDKIFLYNLEGKLLDLYSVNSKAEVHIWGIDLTPGLYFLKIKTSTGAKYFSKLIIK